MNSTTLKWVHLISKGLLSLLMLFSATMYIVKTGAIKAAFTSFGFPTWIIYPLAVAKYLGVAAIWVAPKTWMKDWAYAGFFFNTLLAIGAHVAIGDGGQMAAVLGFLLNVVAFGTHRYQVG